MSDMPLDWEEEEGAFFEGELDAPLFLAASYQERTSVSPACALYEQRKKQWDNENPEATPAERDAALRSIALECGV